METLKNTKSKIATANKDILAFINAFVDGQSFVETDAFVCSQSDDTETVGEGVVSGFASVNDVGVCLFAINSKVMKGAIGELNAKKIVRTINNAVRTDKPLIAVWDTSGARFAEGIGALEGYGSILRAYTVAYGEVPVISVIKGNNFGLSSYVAGISDFVIAYPDGVIASASPLVLAAKTGVDVKSVGSAKQAAQNGIVTEVVKNDKELRAELIKILAVFDGAIKTGDDANRVCKGLKAGASATDVKHNDGRLTADACVKISEFLNICENCECPVVFLTDCIGSEQSSDDASLIREMSNLIYQVNTIDVDMFSVVYGKAIGGAYTALVAPCEYKIAWENAEVGAIESEAAARLLYADEIKSAKDKDKTAAKLASAYGGENCSALVIAKSGYFDNVIEPNLTRSYLIAALLAHVE